MYLHNQILQFLFKTPGSKGIAEWVKVKCARDYGLRRAVDLKAMHETRAHPTAIVSVPSTLNTQKNPVLESHVVSRRTSIYLLPYKQHILPDLT